MILSSWYFHMPHACFKAFTALWIFVMGPSLFSVSDSNISCVNSSRARPSISWKQDNRGGYVTDITKTGTGNWNTRKKKTENWKWSYRYSLLHSRSLRRHAVGGDERCVTTQRTDVKQTIIDRARVQVKFCPHFSFFRSPCSSTAPRSLS